MPIPAPDPKQVALQAEDWIEYRSGFATLDPQGLVPQGAADRLDAHARELAAPVFILQATTGMLLAMT